MARDPRFYVRYMRPDINYEANGRWTEVAVEVSAEALPVLLDHVARQGWLLQEVH